MKKTYLALAFFITSFLLVGNAYGEDEIYYCADIDSNGFDFDKKRGSYKPQGFISKKFKMKLNRASNLIELARGGSGNEVFTCTSNKVTQETIMSCSDIVVFRHFSFNIKNGRFVYSQNIGYVLSDDFSLYVSYGQCDKF